MKFSNNLFVANNDDSTPFTNPRVALAYGLGGPIGQQTPINPALAGGGVNPAGAGACQYAAGFDMVSQFSSPNNPVPQENFVIQCQITHRKSDGTPKLVLNFSGQYNYPSPPNVYYPTFDIVSEAWLANGASRVPSPNTYSRNSSQPASEYSLRWYTPIDPLFVSQRYMRWAVASPAYFVVAQSGDYCTLDSVSLSTDLPVTIGRATYFLTTRSCDLPVPTCSVIATQDPCLFDASGSYIVNDSSNSIQAYDWTFGDGQTGAGATTQHSYDDELPKTAYVTVTDQSGSFCSSRCSFTPPAVGRIGTFTDPHGVMFSAVKEGTGVRVSRFPNGTASRQPLALVPNLSSPSLWQHNTQAGEHQESDAAIYLFGKDATANVWKMFVSDDDGESFDFMANTPFDGTYKVIGAPIGHNCVGLIAVKGTAVSFARTADGVNYDVFANGTKINSVGDLGASAKTLSFHSEFAFGTDYLKVSNGVDWARGSDDGGDTWDVI